MHFRLYTNPEPLLHKQCLIYKCFHTTGFLCTEISWKHWSVCSSLHSSAKTLHAWPLSSTGAETCCHPSLQTLSVLSWCELILKIILKPVTFISTAISLYDMVIDSLWAEVEVRGEWQSNISDWQQFPTFRDLCCCSCTAPPRRIPRSESLHTSSSCDAPIRTCLKWWRRRWGARPPAKVWLKPL